MKTAPNKTLGFVLIVVSIVAFGLTAICAYAPKAMGSDGMPLPTSAVDFPTMFGTGGVISALLGLLAMVGKLAPQIQTIGASVERVVSTVTGGHAGHAAEDTDTNTNTDEAQPSAPEIVQAVLNYSTSPDDDERALRRFVIAALTEISDALSDRSPTIKDALAKLGQVISANWFPTPANSGTVFTAVPSGPFPQFVTSPVSVTAPAPSPLAPKGGE